MSPNHKAWTQNSSSFPCAAELSTDLHWHATHCLDKAIFNRPADQMPHRVAGQAQSAALGKYWYGGPTTGLACPTSSKPFSDCFKRIAVSHEADHPQTCHDKIQMYMYKRAWQDRACATET